MKRRAIEEESETYRLVVRERGETATRQREREKERDKEINR